jgi:hypothetical protein
MGIQNVNEVFCVQFFSQKSHKILISHLNSISEKSWQLFFKSGMGEKTQ